MNIDRFRDDSFKSMEETDSQPCAGTGKNRTSPLISILPFSAFAALGSLHDNNQRKNFTYQRCISLYNTLSCNADGVYIKSKQEQVIHMNTRMTEGFKRNIDSIYIKCEQEAIQTDILKNVGLPNGSVYGVFIKSKQDRPTKMSTNVRKMTLNGNADSIYLQNEQGDIIQMDVSISETTLDESVYSRLIKSEEIKAIQLTTCEKEITLNEKADSTCTKNEPGEVIQMDKCVSNSAFTENIQCAHKK